MKCIPVLLLAALLVACERPPSHDPGPIGSLGIWLGKEEMLPGREDLAARLDRYTDAGFTTIYVATQVRGFVTYPGSDILPQWQDLAEADPNVIGWLVDEIQARGMRAEAWTEYGFYTYWTPDATADPSRGPVLDERPELLAVNAEGAKYLHNPQWGDFYSLCPSNPESHEVLASLYLEMLERYPFDGLNLDRIRYPDGTFCYCGYCTHHFEEDTGVNLGEARYEGRRSDAFVEWRHDRLTRFVAGLAERFRTRFPDRTLTAAVIPPYMVDEKGQNWPHWLDAGYLDAAMPMLYDPEIDEYLDWIEDRVDHTERIHYGLDIGHGWETFRRQVADLQNRDARGVTIWSSHSVDPHINEIARMMGRNGGSAVPER